MTNGNSGAHRAWNINVVEWPKPEVEPEAEAEPEPEPSGPSKSNQLAD